MSITTPSDSIDIAERVDGNLEQPQAIDLSMRKNVHTSDELNKSGNSVNGRNKNRKRKRHHNNNKNNNKKWCKKFKRQPSQQQLMHNNKSDLENLQNVKNSNNNRKYGGMVYGGQKHLKSMNQSIFKNISHRNYRCISLPDKRLRKELIIPPTKFLLGGNISDPLNLNSLQDEALDTSENAATPKSSPITTPPKIEVIIPPNIFDPLHLLQPVDSAEYEKLLTAPMKRKVKHRNRKKKPRKRHDSSSSTVVSSANSTAINMSSDTSELVIFTDDERISDAEKEFQDDRPTNQASAQQSTERERCPKDLRLDLGVDNDGNSSRKRKNFECPNSHKKVRRMDSMDKIVSPVIPQPGAWKRGPIAPPMGAPRNRNRVSSTSTSDDVLTVNSLATINEDAAATASTPSTLAHSPTEDVLQAENKPPPKRRPEKSKYQYGNHCSYQGFAALTDNNDVRLRVFKQYPYLFQNKDILDIGCHAGHVAIAIGRMLNPKSVLGVDIASNLISMAHRNLSLFVRIPTEKSTSSAASKTSETNATTTCKKKKHHKRDRAKVSGFYPISFGITYKGIPRIPGLQSKQSDDQSSTVSADVFPNNVNFKTMNYVDMDDVNVTNDTPQYDLIVCLSVTKYIHLNFGDAGLKSAFKKMFNQLRPGGKLILEAQNWASYEKSKNLTQTMYSNYKSIEFFPNKFQEFLLSTEVGFSHTSLLAVLRHAKGFKRSLQLYVKGDFTPSQICWSDSHIPQTPYEEPSSHIYRAYYAQMRRPRTVRSVWQSDTLAHMSSRFTPHGLSSTSQYYNPLETDSYLPSYDNEIQTRHYCFVSPLYSTVWSPPSGRKSASQTPLFGSIRKVDDGDENLRPHVYIPTGNYDGRDSSRSIDDCSQSPQTSHVYSAATPESRSCREPDADYCSPKGHVYATACDNSSSPQQYSGESSRSIEIEQEDNVEDNLADTQARSFSL
ncbi:7SK snRNA methylphosphate capping enzyme bin3 isoform X2 [Bradysia coprophila]|nr:7SK snRNA methylphosphate capping enzyme bin3 isoform X2 [Bradysia coprophila]